ncbi:hypothetical protein AB1L42_01060 [Thalassoglobus sp. JC818]|uniref:hypothetical protein n=1 Tax=Thalassoglobus sp. JC818 TaxID=3232136 RepID=UPI003459EA69
MPSTNARAAQHNRRPNFDPAVAEDLKYDGRSKARSVMAAEAGGRGEGCVSEYTLTLESLLGKPSEVSDFAVGTLTSGSGQT